MKQLSDLLWEAKADAPPPRFDVDDVVAAGRRRKRRRSATWAAAAAAVLVTAGVAQVVPRGPAVTTAAPSVAPSSTGSFYTFLFRGYRAGDFVVDDPSQLDLGASTSYVRKTGSTEVVANVIVYPPGVVPLGMGTPGKDKGTVNAEPINGRRAYYQGPQLFWEYADNAFADVVGLKPSRADLRAIAEAFVPGQGQPGRVAARVGYFPAGFRLISINGSTESFSMNFLPTSTTSKLMAGPDRNVEVGLLSELLQIRIAEPVRGRAIPDVLTCDAREKTCAVSAGGGKQLTVSGGEIPLSEVRKIAESIAPADLTDVGSWPTVGEALPTSALLTETR
ncbi:hypothetical protein [Actinoplanes sp. NPDC020271]|uniref:hypothetical protein n=1 Tax=Actinoplanes sp. NPDC020271 TaxID=3363896 RepID=UPI0037BA787D